MEPFNQPLVSGSTSCIAYYNQLAIDYLPSTTRNAVFQGCNPPHFFIHQTTIASRGWLCNRLMSSRILPPIFFLSLFFTFNKRFSNIFHFDIFYFSISNKNVACFLFGRIIHYYIHRFWNKYIYIYIYIGREKNLDKKEKMGRISVLLAPFPEDLLRFWGNPIAAISH